MGEFPEYRIFKNILLFKIRHYTQQLDILHSLTLLQKQITIVKCAIFIATQNCELGDECKDIWHAQTQNMLY